MKTKICILLLIFLASCGVNKRRQAEKIVQRFEEENIADKREVVFNIQPLFEQGKLVIEGETSDSQLKSTDNEPEKVTHVGISLGGPEFIHASGRVKINSLHPDSSNFSEYRRNSFIRARRIKGAEGTEGIIKIGEHPWY